MQVGGFEPVILQNLLSARIARYQYTTKPFLKLGDERFDIFLKECFFFVFLANVTAICMYMGTRAFTRVQMHLCMYERVNACTSPSKHV